MGELIMLKQFILLCSFGITACGNGKDYARNAPLVGPADLVERYYDFLGEAAAAGITGNDDNKVARIQYGPLDDHKIGLCEYKSDGYVITIRDDLAGNSAWYRDQVLLHEIAHCSFHEPHFEQSTDLMNSILKDYVLIGSNFDFFKHQLFQRIRDRPAPKVRPLPNFSSSSNPN
jgi:hypothetical protein